MNNKKIININNVKLSCYKAGKGKTILFLHGNRLRAKTFESLLSELAQQYHVLAPDVPGYGDSAIPNTIWSYHEYASFFKVFLEKLKLRDVTVIGYSMGGGIAYHLASISSNVSRLIVVDSAGIEEGSKSKLRRDVDRCLFYITRPQYFSTFITLIKEYILFLLKYAFDMKYINKMRRELEESSSYESNISVLTTIIWAENDTIFPISIAEKLHKCIKGSKLITVNENHDWVLYKSKYFNRLIISDLADSTS